MSPTAGTVWPWLCRKLITDPIPCTHVNLSTSNWQNGASGTSTHSLLLFNSLESMKEFNFSYPSLRDHREDKWASRAINTLQMCGVFFGGSSQNWFGWSCTTLAVWHRGKGTDCADTKGTWLYPQTFPVPEESRDFLSTAWKTKAGLGDFCVCTN